ncbi:MFS transporter [Coraliomargarita algicola]|uniref:MFS transporter n=1 Tax=Coraliomargarita algicola TaxID=3092156 RepID=A0ABZ0RLL2_9BACT|nr:MFS transporter [Coraliomargarita sp. J2-16]WPJ97106.1 MFS transporter [Coraliomargarita sp. J2-16]
MRYISIGIGIVSILLGVLPGIFVKERYYTKTQNQEKQNLIAGLKQTLKTRPFLILVSIVFTKSLGFGLVGSLGFYVNAYYVCGGDLKQAGIINGVKASLLILPNLLSVPLCTWLSSHYGKRFVLYFIGISGILGYLSVYIFYTPANPWLQIIPTLLIAPLSSGIWLIAPAMQADIADYDELRTGKRREGSFSAVFSWVLKVSATITTGLGGFVLVLTGFDILHGADQPEHVLDNLVNYYVWIPVTFSIINLGCIHFYDLTRERMEEIRAELEAIRGTR